MREPTLILQPPGSYCCGQACLAMLMGWDLADVCKVMGKTGRTRTKEIVHFLDTFGCKCARGRRPLRQLYSFPYSGLYWLRFEGRHLFHWQLHWRGKVYDPQGKIRDESWRAISVITVEWTPWLGDGYPVR
jgi:hypothetical protein